MKIAIFVLCYNEVHMLPFFYLHYRRLADKIVVYDNESPDGSAELARNLGFDVRIYSTGGEHREDEMTALRNSCWKEAKGQGYDWVFVLDMDELLYHPDILGYLESCKTTGTTVCIPEGYNMVGDQLPIHDSSILEQIKLGVPANDYCKPVIFNPDAIEEMNLAPGSHTAKPVGRIKIDASGKLKMLHFHWLSLRYVLDRNLWRDKRRSETCRQRGWGRQYSRGDQWNTLIYNNMRIASFNAIEHVETGIEVIKNTRRRLQHIKLNLAPRKPFTA